MFQAGGILFARLAFQHGAGPVEGAYVRLASGTVALLAVGVGFGMTGAWAASLSRRGTLC